MKKDNFADFRYRLVESTIINHKTVEVTYRCNGKVIKRYVFVKEAPGVDYIKYAQNVIAQEFNDNQIISSSQKLAKPTSHRALKAILATTLSLGVVTFAGLYTWRHFQNIADQHNIVADGVATEIMALSEISTEAEIKKARENYERLTKEEKKAVPSEVLEYLENQESLLAEDKDIAESLYDELDSWIDPSDVVVTNGEKYPELRVELLPMVDKYNHARQRAQKYFDKDLDNEGKNKFNRYVIIASQAKNLFDQMEYLSGHAAVVELDEVKALEEKYNKSDDFLKKPPYDVELKNPIIKLRENIEEAIEQEKEDAGNFVVKTWNVTIDKEGHSIDYADTTFETIKEFNDQYLELINLYPRIGNYIDEACRERGFANDYSALLTKAYELLTKDKNQTLSFFNRLAQLEADAIDITVDINEVQARCEKLILDVNECLYGEGRSIKEPRIFKLLTQNSFFEDYQALTTAIDDGIEDAEYVYNEIIDYTSHTTTAEHQGTVCTENDIDDLEYRYQYVINRVAKRLVDKALGGVGEFEKYITLARDYLEEDIKIVNRLCDELNELYLFENLPITETDKRLAHLLSAYQNYNSNGYRRIIKLAQETGFETKLFNLINAVSKANALYKDLVEYTEPDTLAMKEDIEEIDNEYMTGPTVLRNIVDKIIQTDGKFKNWDAAINRAKNLYNVDEAEAKKLCTDLNNLIEQVPTSLQDSEFIAVGNRYNSASPRAKKIADINKFSDNYTTLKNAIIEANDIYDKLVEYAVKETTMCNTEQIGYLQERYAKSGLVANIVDKIIENGSRFESWDKAIEEINGYLVEDQNIAKTINGYFDAITSSTDPNTRMASAYELVTNQDIWEELNSRNRAKSFVNRLSTFEEYYSVYVNNKIKSAANAENIYEEGIFDFRNPSYDPSAGRAVSSITALVNTDTKLAAFTKDKVKLDSGFNLINFAFKLDWITGGIDYPTIVISKTPVIGAQVEIARYNFASDKNGKYVSLAVEKDIWNLIDEEDTVEIYLHLPDTMVSSRVTVTNAYQIKR